MEWQTVGQVMILMTWTGITWAAFFGPYVRARKEASDGRP
jgi:hypothetical protein